MWTFYEIALAKDRDITKDPDVYQQLSEIAHFQIRLPEKVKMRSSGSQAKEPMEKQILRH